MPKVTANNCEMFYEIDDFTDPWVTDKDTVWLQHLLDIAIALDLLKRIVAIARRFANILSKPVSQGNETRISD